MILKCLQQLSAIVFFDDDEIINDKIISGIWFLFACLNSLDGIFIHVGVSELSAHPCDLHVAVRAFKEASIASESQGILGTIDDFLRGKVHIKPIMINCKDGRKSLKRSECIACPTFPLTPSLPTHACPIYVHVSTLRLKIPDGLCLQSSSSRNRFCFIVIELLNNLF